jgi:hypothetical protein
MSPAPEVILIPRLVVPHVYRDAYFLLASAASEVLPLVERIDCELHPERFTEPLRRFDRARGLLDALGWHLPDGDVHVGIEQPEILLDVVNAATITATDLLESGREDGIAWKSERQIAAELDELNAFKAAIERAIRQLHAEDMAKDGDALSSMARTHIPADVVVLLRGALYTELARACEDAPGTMPEAHTRSGWADVLARIEGTCRALDVIGWDAPARQQDVEVELDAAMIDALEADTDLWAWLAEQDRTETAEGRRRAAAKAKTIKRFLASVTLGLIAV